jgi:hypothetical protein
MTPVVEKGCQGVGQKGAFSVIPVCLSAQQVAQAQVRHNPVCLSASATGKLQAQVLRKTPCDLFAQKQLFRHTAGRTQIAGEMARG